MLASVLSVTGEMEWHSWPDSGESRPAGGTNSKTRTR